MLSWLGMKNTDQPPRATDFFAGRSSRLKTLTLLSALILFFLITTILSALVPASSMADELVRIFPALIGMLTAALFVMVVERATQK
ncbi:MAG: hypothetical protein Q4A31_04320 [Corynebacterium sp.]|uniref:hypothetical protein n=1 Tax=Corynebacterium sp. TaxID=1720 RepID=UPI0026DD08CB|nr:hypothetical protein [Corynebacterium sp.]MDO4761126.1 hypothetical protein [Corynebacterium sp.]